MSEHDKKMEQIYNDEYYGGYDEERPEFEHDEEIG